MEHASQARGLVTLVLEKHGIRAPAVALHEALKARGSGDADRAETWTEVAKLAEDALRAGLG
jgi:hypothetical protein